MQETQLIFLFSLPRAGSTFVQRILASHEAISTSPESWVAVPLMYSNRGGVAAIYDHETQRRAYSEFVNHIRGGESTLRELRKSYFLGAFGAAKNASSRYFLEKTPRNSLFCTELLSMFPEAKKIFLWRNPLSVVSSIIETFGEGKWRLYNYYVDLYEGIEGLLDGWTSRPSAALSVRYEDLVTKPMSEWSRVFAFLDLPFDENVLQKFGEVKLSSVIGDRTGVEAYSGISAEPLEKWRTTICNPFRKNWAMRYLEWLGDERIAQMGYLGPQLREQLRENPVCGRNLASDGIRSMYGELDRRINLHLWRRWISGAPTSGHCRTYR